MTIEIIRDMLFWCSVINFGLLFWWFLFFTLAHDWMYRVHGRWFKLSPEPFDIIHYSGMTFFKLCIIIFTLVPFAALTIIR